MKKLKKFLLIKNLIQFNGVKILKVKILIIWFQEIVFYNFLTISLTNNNQNYKQSLIKKTRSLRHISKTLLFSRINKLNMLPLLKTILQFLILLIRQILFLKKAKKIAMKQPIKNRFYLMIISKSIRMKFYQKKVLKIVMKLAKRKIHTML